jgi:ABC-type glycerol-3-phosphate transport system permease component
MGIVDKAVTQPGLSTGSLTRLLTSGERRWQLLVWFILVVGAIAMAMPFVWMVSSSLKLQQNIFQFPPQWIPNPVRTMNYVDALTYKPFHLYFKNTFIIMR